MKIKLILAAILFAASAQAIEADKFAHFGAGYIIGDVAFNVCTSWLHLGEDEPKWFCHVASMLTVGVIGGLKEGFDKKPDGKDFGATVLGGATANVKVRVLRF